MLNLEGLLRNIFTANDYQRSLVLELESVDEDWLMAYENIKRNKGKVAWHYNKHISIKQFREGDLVWKTMLSLGFKDPKLEKWSPT